jgi:hypothetical protein
MDGVDMKSSEEEKPKIKITFTAPGLQRLLLSHPDSFLQKFILELLMFSPSDIDVEKIIEELTASLKDFSRDLCNLQVEMENLCQLESKTELKEVFHEKKTREFSQEERESLINLRDEFIPIKHRDKEGLGIVYEKLNNIFKGKIKNEQLRKIFIRWFNQSRIQNIPRSLIVNLFEDKLMFRPERKNIWIEDDEIGFFIKSTLIDFDGKTHGETKFYIIFEKKNEEDLEVKFYFYLEAGGAVLEKTLYLFRDEKFLLEKIDCYVEFLKAKKGQSQAREELHRLKKELIFIRSQHNICIETYLEKIEALQQCFIHTDFNQSYAFIQNIYYLPKRKVIFSKILYETTQESELYKKIIKKLEEIEAQIKDGKIKSKWKETDFDRLYNIFLSQLLDLDKKKLYKSTLLKYEVSIKKISHKTKHFLLFEVLMDFLSSVEAIDLNKKSKKYITELLMLINKNIDEIFISNLSDSAAIWRLIFSSIHKAKEIVEIFRLNLKDFENDFTSLRDAIEKTESYLSNKKEFVEEIACKIYLNIEEKILKRNENPSQLGPEPEYNQLLLVMQGGSFSSDLLISLVNLYTGIKFKKLLLNNGSEEYYRYIIKKIFCIKLKFQKGTTGRGGIFLNKSYFKLIKLLKLQYSQENQKEYEGIARWIDAIEKNEITPIVDDLFGINYAKNNEKSFKKAVQEKDLLLEIWIFERLIELVIKNTVNPDVFLVLREIEASNPTSNLKEFSLETQELMLLVGAILKVMEPILALKESEEIKQKLTKQLTKKMLLEYSENRKEKNVEKFIETAKKGKTFSRDSEYKKLLLIMQQSFISSTSLPALVELYSGIKAEAISLENGNEGYYRKIIEAMFSIELKCQEKKIKTKDGELFFESLYFKLVDLLKSKSSPENQKKYFEINRKIDDYIGFKIPILKNMKIIFPSDLQPYIKINELQDFCKDYSDVKSELSYSIDKIKKTNELAEKYYQRTHKNIDPNHSSVSLYQEFCSFSSGSQENIDDLKNALKKYYESIPKEIADQVKDLKERYVELMEDQTSIDIMRMHSSVEYLVDGKKYKLSANISSLEEFKKSLSDIGICNSEVQFYLWINFNQNKGSFGRLNFDFMRSLFLENSNLKEITSVRSEIKILFNTETELLTVRAKHKKTDGISTDHFPITNALDFLDFCLVMRVFFRKAEKEPIFEDMNFYFDLNKLDQISILQLRLFFRSLFCIYSVDNIDLPAKKITEFARKIPDIFDDIDEAINDLKKSHPKAFSGEDKQRLIKNDLESLRYIGAVLPRLENKSRDVGKMKKELGSVEQVLIKRDICRFLFVKKFKQDQTVQNVDFICDEVECVDLFYEEKKEIYFVPGKKSFLWSSILRLPQSFSKKTLSEWNEKLFIETLTFLKSKSPGLFNELFGVFGKKNFPPEFLILYLSSIDYKQSCRFWAEIEGKLYLLNTYKSPSVDFSGYMLDIVLAKDFTARHLTSRYALQSVIGEPIVIKDHYQFSVLMKNYDNTRSQSIVLNKETLGKLICWDSDWGKKIDLKTVTTFYIDLLSDKIQDIKQEGIKKSNNIYSLLQSLLDELNLRIKKPENIFSGKSFSIVSALTSLSSIFISTEGLQKKDKVSFHIEEIEKIDDVEQDKDIIYKLGLLLKAIARIEKFEKEKHSYKYCTEVYERIRVSLIALIDLIEKEIEQNQILSYKESTESKSPSFSEPRVSPLFLTIKIPQQDPEPTESDQSSGNVTPKTPILGTPRGFLSLKL